MEEKNNMHKTEKTTTTTTTTTKQNKKIDLSRFYASDNSYSTQKQTRIMAPLASRTKA